jgi:hypothetical protein
MGKTFAVNGVISSNSAQSVEGGYVPVRRDNRAIKAALRGAKVRKILAMLDEGEAHRELTETSIDEILRG